MAVHNSAPEQENSEVFHKRSPSILILKIIPTCERRLSSSGSQAVHYNFRARTPPSMQEFRKAAAV